MTAASSTTATKKKSGMKCPPEQPAARDIAAVDVGTISISSVVADSAGAERKLVFDPTQLTDGIELSDDPLPALRAEVNSLSAQIVRRHGRQRMAQGRC